MNLSFVSCLQAIACVSTLCLGALVLWKRPDRQTSWYFALCTIGTSLWNLSLFVAMTSIGQPTLWGRLAISFGAFMPAGFFIFLASFPPQDRHFRAKRLIVGMFALFFFVLPLTPLVVRRAWVVDGRYLSGDLGPWYFAFWAYYLGFLVLAFIQCAVKYRAAKHTPYREQLRYMTFGFLLFFVPLIVTQFLLPLLGIFQYNNLGPLFALPMLAAIGYAIARHKLLDIRIVIQRGVIYAVILAAAMGTYAALLQLFGRFIGRITDTEAIVSAAVTTAVGVLFIRPLENYFRRVTDPIFFKGTYDYGATLHAISSIMYTCLNEREILERSAAIFRQTFKTDDVRFAFGPCEAARVSEEEQSAGFETLAHPISFDNNAIGAVRFGRKRSGDRYTEQDLQLVSTFAFQAAIAIGKARLHEEVRRYSTHLEELVGERTAEIKKLQEEQERHMIDISHNLQTPLAVIKGELELLGDEFSESERGRAVGGSLDRISGFIRQFLRLARMEKQAAEIELTQLDLAALLREQADYFESMAEGHGARIIAAIPAERFALPGNRRLLEELFTNLVANSLAYRHPERRAEVRISLWRDGTNAVISVQDNGMGIAAEDVPHVFERFYRAPGAAQAHSGSGLGLAIAKQIAETHGGAVSVASTPDEGTVVTVRLPLV